MLTTIIGMRISHAREPHRSFLCMPHGWDGHVRNRKVGARMTYEQTLEVVRKEMAGEPAEIQIEYRLDVVLREMDEFVAMAANPETIDLIERNKILIGQIMTRTQLICSFLMARNQKPGLRVISNG
jgi:hypothetical protein